jgi:hypothetical protein
MNTSIIIHRKGTKWKSDLQGSMFEMKMRQRPLYVIQGLLPLGFDYTDVGHQICVSCVSRGQTSSLCLLLYLHRNEVYEHVPPYASRGGSQLLSVTVLLGAPWDASCASVTPRGRYRGGRRERIRQHAGAAWSMRWRWNLWALELMSIIMLSPAPGFSRFLVPRAIIVGLYIGSKKRFVMA